MKRRIAVGGIFTESNHLVGRLTRMEDFARTELRRGAEVAAATEGVAGGMLKVLRSREADVVPLLWASAVPGGPLNAACYLALKQELIERLRAALPVDGVLLPQHGAAAVDGLGSLDGDLLTAVRAVVGERVPVVATLDCHAHVTPEMVAHADALVAWETYPHRDTETTGERGARLLLDTVEGRVRPAMAMAKVPVIVGGYMGSTDDGPFARFMEATKALERSAVAISTSAFLVQPQLDLAGMGGGALVITDGDRGKAVEHAVALARMYWDLRFELEPRIWTPGEAIADGLRTAGGPMLLLETSDCVGGGATGDSAAVLRALLAGGLDEPAMACVVDPEAAAECHRHGTGAVRRLRLGHRLDPQWGQPLETEAEIERLTDGTFVYSGGIWGGQTGRMGPSARLRIGNVHVLVASQGTYDWADEQYRSVGLDAGPAKFVVVKNPMNYRVGYHGRYRKVYVLDTPGPTPASMRHVPFRRLREPFFPRQQEIPGLEPVVLLGR